MAQMQLDADPATVVDWGNGAWQRYENAQGSAGDTGGTSCTFKPYIAPEAGAAPPATSATCAAATPPVSPPPPPNNGGGGGGGGGGASLGLLALVLGLLAVRPSRFRMT
jgi:hypothetical protein